MFVALFLLSYSVLQMPVQIAPTAGAELHGYPGAPLEIAFRWSAVEGAESYAIEIDCKECCAAGKFCSEVNPGGVYRFRDLQSTHLNFEWVGLQPGRWRVWAIAGFNESEKTPWRDFTYKMSDDSVPPRAPELLSPASNEALPPGSQARWFSWKPVTGAESYVLEVDRWNSCASGKWCSQVGNSQTIENLKQPTAQVNVSGDQRTRWRVWAVAGSRNSLKSDWRELGAGASPSVTASAAAPPVAPPVAPPPNFPGKRTFPTKVYGPQPEYTNGARADHVQGSVVLALTVMPDGSVSGVKVIRSLHPELDRAAVETVKTWRFTPGTKDGVPVPVATQIEVNFNLL